MFGQNNACKMVLYYDKSEIIYIKGNYRNSYINKGKLKSRKYYYILAVLPAKTLYFRTLCLLLWLLRQKT